MFDEKRYWNRRYSRGRGSSLARNKEEDTLVSKYINDFIKARSIKSVLDLGCGDGEFLKLIKCSDYHGIDIAHVIIKKLNAEFKDEDAKNFYWLDNMPNLMADLVISINTVNNLVSDNRFEEHFDIIAARSRKYAIIFGIDTDENYSAGSYMRRRKFLSSIKNRSFELLSDIKINESNMYMFKKA